MVSNYDIVHQCLNSDLSYRSSYQLFQPEEPLQLPPEGDNLLFSCNNDESFQFSDSFNNPFLNPDELLFYPDNTSCYLPSSFSDDNLISLTPDIFPLESQDFESYPLHPKRQKTNPNNFFSSYYGYVPNPPITVPELLTELPVLLPEIPGSFGCGKAENGLKKQNNGGESLSVQSIAARERRRKITEKTQELGKLVPGGHRMNTAEMFQAAAKYVKFLQAQVKVLQSIQEREEEHETKEMQTLLRSTIIQEKLYIEEKCLVPKEFVETLTNDPEIQSKSRIFGGIDQLLKVKEEDIVVVRS